MKKLIALLVVLVMTLTFSATAFAAPFTYGSVGNASDILVIKKPENAQSQSNKTVYPVSGVAALGSTVTVYKQSPVDGLYYAMTNSEGKSMQTTVGASGLFCFNVQLGSGDNNLAVESVAAGGAKIQRTFIKINLVSQGWLDSIKGLLGIFK